MSEVQVIRCPIVYWHRVQQWVFERIPKVEGWLGEHRCLIAVEQHRAEEVPYILGAVVYDGFTPYECNLHVVVSDKRCVSRRVLRAVFGYPFKQVGLKRVTAQVAASNEKSQAFVRSLGFMLEGRKRAGMGDEDELIFGLLAEDCRWL